MKPSVILSLLVFGALILATKPSVLPLEAQEDDKLEHPTGGIEPEATQIQVREKRFLPLIPLLPWILSINMTEMAILRAQKFAKEKFIENWQTLIVETVARVVGRWLGAPTPQTLKPGWTCVEGVWVRRVYSTQNARS